MAIAEQASGERTTCQIEVQLTDGERIAARVEGDRGSARRALAEVHSRLDAQTFVLVGEDTVVRSEDLRFVRLRDDDESGGILGSQSPARAIPTLTAVRAAEIRADERAARR